MTENCVTKGADAPLKCTSRNILPHSRGGFVYYNSKMDPTHEQMKAEKDFTGFQVIHIKYSRYCDKLNTIG